MARLLSRDKAYTCEVGIKELTCEENIRGHRNLVRLVKFVLLATTKGYILVRKAGQPLSQVLKIAGSEKMII